MAQPYVGEIRIFAGNFAPTGWAFCDGALLSIAEYDTLFNLIGTTYGGDGQSTYAVPDLRGRVPVHQGTRPGGQTWVIGQTFGTEEVTLIPTQIPQHNHGAALMLPVGGTPQTSPQLGAPAAGAVALYSGSTNATYYTLSQPGASAQPHENRAPYLALTYIISLFGIFPSPA